MGVLWVDAATKDARSSAWMMSSTRVIGQDHLAAIALSPVFDARSQRLTLQGVPDQQVLPLDFEKAPRGATPQALPTGDFTPV
jgi:hypothetical protein